MIRILPHAISSHTITVSVFFALLIFFGVNQSKGQAEISPYLAARMQEAESTGSLIRAIIMLREPVDLESLDHSLLTERASPRYRATAVINALQKRAASSQADLLSYLSAQPSQDLRRFTPYWVANMVLVEASGRLLQELSNRRDIASLDYYAPPIEDDSEDDGPASPSSPNSAEQGLRAVNAHRLWALGYTGAGRLVMNIDSGVEGTHPALRSRWRGNHVPASQAWLGDSTFPNACTEHGTHVLGTVTGLDPATNDTIGIAPGAEWIAAQAIGCGVTTFDALQWALDPDGNPGTTDDMPDVIANSWTAPTGEIGQCLTASYGAVLTALETAGIAVVFSAGNAGPNPQTITAPKNINISLVNTFATGNIDGNTAGYPLQSSSSRGPSGCGGTGSLFIKPEAVAPGVNVRSSILNGQYGARTGTSHACPHVAGSVALLKQMYPNRTGAEIKLALYQTARETPSDLAVHDPGEPPGSTSGEDNNFGMGLIDAFAAALRLSPYQIVGTVISSGDTLPLSGAILSIPESDIVAVTDSGGAFAFGSLRDSVQLRITAYAHYDTTIDLFLQPHIPETLNVTLHATPLSLFTGSVTDSITGNGVAADVEFFEFTDPSGGPTATTRTNPDGSFAAATIAGTYRIVVRPPLPYPEVVIRDSIALIPAGTEVHVLLREAEVIIVDDDAGENYEKYYQSSLDRIGRTRRTFSVADSSAPVTTILPLFAQRPVLVWFTGNDTTGALTPEERGIIIDHLAAGGSLVLSGQNIAEFSTPDDTLLQDWFGVKANGNSTDLFVRGFDGDIIGNGLNYSFFGGAGNQTSKDRLMITGNSIGSATKTMHYRPNDDTTSIAAVRVLGPNSGWAATYFAFGLESMLDPWIDTLLTRSFRYFGQSVTSAGEPWVADTPSDFRLEQNYPNPFNPTTTIRYSLPERSRVRAVIYDMTGRVVRRLLEQDMDAGTHAIEWNGMNDHGIEVATGMYLLSVQATGKTGTSLSRIRKMILMK